MPYLAAIPVLIALALVGVGLVLWGLWDFRRARDADGPFGSDAESLGFADTLRVVPLKLLVGLDLLDLGLDVLAAPLVWVMLDRAGLKSLRSVAALEALVPFTQPVPLLTLSWALVRAHDLVRSPRSVGKTPRADGVAAVGSSGSSERPPRRRVANLAR